MSILWVSDLHLGHEKVADLRGFASTAEHDRWVEFLWRDAVTDEDEVYVLGDLSVDERTFEYVDFIISSLPGRKHLVSGNHDPCASIHSQAHRGFPGYLKVFEALQDFAIRTLGGHRLHMSHYPYLSSTNPDHTDVPRYPDYRISGDAPLLHGHTHGKERMHDGNQLHVGLDAWGRMVKLVDVEKFLSAVDLRDQDVISFNTVV